MTLRQEAAVLEQRRRIVRIPFKIICGCHILLSMGQIVTAFGSIPNYTPMLPLTAVAILLLVLFIFLDTNRSLFRAAGLFGVIVIHCVQSALFLPFFYEINAVSLIYLVIVQLDIFLISAAGMLYGRPVEMLTSLSGIAALYVLYQCIKSAPDWFWLVAAGTLLLLLFLLNGFLTARSQHLFVQDTLAETRRLNQRLTIATSQLMSNRQRENLAVLTAGLAHEINNPINFLMGNAVYLRKYVQQSSLGENPEILDILCSFESGFESISRVTARLRELYLQKDSPPKKVLLRDIIDSCLTATSLHTAARISISVPDGLSILAHPADLYSVIANMLSNASDAINGDGEICIRAEEDSDVVSIAIRDTGCGISSSDLENIFEPFYTTKPEKEGMGVGLPLSKALVAKMGGTIWVQSKEREYTQFTITLPKKAR